MKSTQAKIQSFLDLPDGWHYGSGCAPTHERVGRAIGILNYYTVTGFNKTDAFPGIDGEILVTAYHGNHNLAITLEVDGTFRFEHECGNEEVFYKEGLSSAELVAILENSIDRVFVVTCTSSDLFIPDTTSIPNLVNSGIWLSAPSGTTLGTQGYLVSRQSAPNRAVNPSAPTQSSFIGQSHPIRPYSGGSMNPRFHPIAA